jgi:hypothetical protein
LRPSLKLELMIDRCSLEPGCQRLEVSDQAQEEHHQQVALQMMCLTCRKWEPIDH